MRIPQGSLADWASRPLFRVFSRRGRKPHNVDRTYWVKRALVVATFIAALAFLDWAQETYSGDSATADTPPPLTIFLMIAFPMWVIADYRIRRSRVHDVLDGASSPPILLLRSFEHDDEIVKHFPVWFSPQTWSTLSRPRQLARQLSNWHRFTFETLLSRACKNEGPVVGIGEPGEIVPSSGMFTEYYDGAGWEERVRVLMSQAQLVVFRAGTSNGLLRELRSAVEDVEPERVLIFIGRSEHRLHPVVAALGWYRSNSTERERFYRKFASISGPYFPRGLPPSIGNHKFIRFESDWTPVLISQKSRSRSPDLAEQTGLWLDLATSGAPA